MRTFILLFLLSFAAATLSAQCPTGDYKVRFEINPDEFYDEVSWRISTLDGAVIYENGFCADSSLQVFNYCIPNTGKCLLFSLRDQYDDGIAPDGYYRLYVNDSLVRAGGDYRMRDNTTFGCPQGDFCSNPFPIDTGDFTTPTGGETWYRYVPPATGTYNLNTCTGNACATKLWVYDHCNNLVANNNQTGSIFYAENGCPGGASATLFLAGGQTYFFRVAYAPGFCTAPIKGHLKYIGAVKGCTDPNACNYNPLATISDTCYYPGDPNCAFAPDLLVDKQELRESMVLETIENPDQCAVDEGCLRGLGTRTVIRFSTRIANIGNQDFFIGTPPPDPNAASNQFIWDPCHEHWHYRGYAEYVVMNADKEIPIGSKNGFCVLDLECGNGLDSKYTCEKMGITAGCSDIYDFELPCQWIDITGLDAGVYAMVVRVNWTKKPDTLGHIERDYENNWAQVCFRLSYNVNTPVMEIIEDCENYRDCLGVPLGNAVPDCEGICNGAALYGDWNRDSLRTSPDVAAYLDAAYEGNGLPTRCNDLYADSLINLLDAAALQECALHGDDPAYWIQRLPCHFPILPDNTDGTMFLYPGKIDTLAKTFEVRALNTQQRVMGYDFTVNGLQIDSIVSLSTEFKGNIRFNAQGHIQVWSPTENTMERHLAAAPVLRIHYKKTTAPKVCLSAFKAAVNARYRPMRAQLPLNACITTPITTGIGEPDPQGPTVSVQPNPLSDRTTFFFDNPSAEALSLSIFDATGRCVHTAATLRGESYEWKTDGLVPGVYWYVLRNAGGSARGRLVVK